MKKTILTIVISLISSATFAQVRIIEAGQNEREKLAGLELKKFANHHYLGTGLSVGAGIMIAVGYSMIMQGNNDLYNSQYPQTQNRTNRAENKIITGVGLNLAGYVLALAGVVYKIEAPLHIKKAGLILSGNGVGINVKLN